MTILRCIILLLLAGTGLQPALPELYAKEITIFYLERPPYYFSDSDEAKGILIDLTKQIFEEAGISYEMVSYPPIRIIRELQKAEKARCSVGWFKLPDREEYATFTHAFYQDEPQRILTSVGSQNQVMKHRTLSALFNDKSLVIGTVATFKYGEYIDRLLNSEKPVTFEVKSAQTQLVRLLAIGRIHYFVIAPEEIDSLIDQTDLNRDLFITHSLDDMPDGNKRYLMCSKSVDDATISRLNLAITKLISPRIWKE